MVVYHWTTKKKAKEILIKGLKKYSFICKEPMNYKGDVLLEIQYHIEWENREHDAEWQEIIKEHIKPEMIKRLDI